MAAAWLSDKVGITEASELPTAGTDMSLAISIIRAEAPGSRRRRPSSPLAYSSAKSAQSEKWSQGH